MAVNSNNNMNQENNMNSQCVRALYSYEYSDAGRRVWMEEGETFCLLQGVENEDWWHVYRPDDIHDTFYVPSSYVRKVESGNVNTIDINTDSPGCGVNDAYTTHNKSLNHTNSYDGSTGKLGTFGTAQIQMDPQEGSKDDYINVGLKPYSSSSSHSESKESFTVQYIQAKRPSDLQDINEGDYANLEDLRSAINLPPVSQPASQTPPSPQTPEGDYANLADMNVGEQSPPPLESCEYKKTLLDTWDMYLDPHTNRIFYVHKETKETQWKPPRGQYHQQMKMQRGGSGNSPTKSPTSELAEKTFPKPESPPSQGLQVQGHTQGLVQGPRHGHQVSDRFQKSRSVMLENLQLGNRYVSNAGPPPPKSATLPPNFSTPAFETQENYGGRKSSQPEIQFTQSVQLNEPIEGMLNRCKLTNGKKGSKKWAFSFAKLTGTNLVFYKDQKSSQPKSGAPHGKSEQMLALRDCSLEKDPKDIGSKKKNMILISSPDGQMILQSEDDAKIQEWFLKLHMKIQELGGNPDAVPADTPNELLTPDTHPALTKKPSFKGRHGRNPSDGGSTLERKGRIKDVLTNFMKNRSEKKELVKKGIYKDAVFGADLKLICEREKTKVPCFVTRAIEAIERRGLDHEGIYRIGGNISSIQKLRCMVDQGEKYDLHDPLWDINILCGTLKLLFRELKEPLFTYSLFDKFLKSFLKEIASERLKAMKATINELPKCHYETVKVLFKHLNKVMDHSLENKMHAHQLAIVFGPTLIWPEVQSQNLATSMVYQSRIVEFVLLEYNNIFR